MRYHIEQRLHTLAQCAISSTTEGQYGFTIEQLSFSHWKTQNDEGWWTHDFWLVTSELEAPNYREAYRLFSKKLLRIVPRMTLVNQCYTEHLAQPVLIKRLDRDIGFVWWVLDRKPVGLMFMEEEKHALDLLLGHRDVPEEFFYYWRDAVNTFGYSSKLLIMLSAVEALTGIPHNERRQQRFYDKLEEILGPDLKRVFWGTREDHRNALRHRLIHGEYFNPRDDQTDYLVPLHYRIMQYFNEKILGESLLQESVVNPQRHLFGNADQARSFLRPRHSTRLQLTEILADAEQNGIDNLACYETLLFSDYDSSY